MKKILFILTLAAMSLSSCLKDTPNTNFTGIGPVLELPYAGLQYFGRDAVTSGADTIVLKFGINMASVQPLSTATNYTLVVDPALTAAYNAKNSAVAFTTLPAGTYTISKLSGTIPAGKRLDSVTVTIYKNKLDPSMSYLLPIKLASTSNGIVSGNFNAHYYHIIGNDFAGVYEHYYTRWNVPDSTGAPSTPRSDKGTDTFYPVNPTSFTVVSDYYYQPAYLVSFTKTGSGPTATYSNWTVTFPADQIASGLTGPSGGSVTLNSGPIFAPHQIAYSSTRQYSFAESLKLFRFFYTTNARAIADEFIKQ